MAISKSKDEKKRNKCVYVYDYLQLIFHKYERRTNTTWIFFSLHFNETYIYIHMSKPWFTFNKGFVYDVIRRKEIDNMHIILKGFILMNKNRSRERKKNILISWFIFSINILLFLFYFKINWHLLIPLMTRYRRYHNLSTHFYVDC